MLIIPSIGILLLALIPWMYSRGWYGDYPN
jgi:hypothetical protein